MEHTIESLAHNEHHAKDARKEIYRVTIILSVFTVIELIIGFGMIGMPDGFLRNFLKGVIVIFMMAKAAYIVGYFMHLKHEVRNFMMTIVVPLFLFVWFIIAFLTDGNSYKNLKNNFDRHHKESSMEKAPVKEENNTETHKGVAE